MEINALKLDTDSSGIKNCRDVYKRQVGCSSRKAWPKQAEKVGVGSVMPRSVPASLAVKPDRK